MLCGYLRNCASYTDGVDNFRKIMKKRGLKVKNGADKPWMAHVKGICAGLVGPKSENVGFSVVLPLLFEGSKAAGVRQPNEK